MINRIRDIRKAKNLTLADVAARCTPPTTAQTIGRLETGMRQLSLTWMNRIAAALEVEPELLAQIARDEAALADPALYTRDPAKFAALTKAIETARAEKDAAEERWLELAEQVEG